MGRNGNSVWKSIWKVISASTTKSVEKAIANDATFRFDINMGRNAVLHLNNKPISFIVKKVVNDRLREDRYKVYAIRYRFRGSDVFVTRPY